MINRKNYDQKIIGVFEIIGSYFVDVFYNNHYLVAKQEVGSGYSSSSITDAYRNKVYLYMTGMSKRDDLFKIVVHKLHEFYQKTSGFGTIILSDFQDRVLSQFIPPEYYRDFTNRHKDSTLREILLRTVNEFGVIVTSKDILYKIIDNHSNRDNIVELQDRIVDLFIIQREDYYSKFAREISKQNAGDQSVNKEVFDKLKNAYLLEKKKSCEVSADLTRAYNIINGLLTKVKELETSSSARDTDAEIAVLSGKLREAESEVDRLSIKAKNAEIEVDRLRLENAKITTLESENAILTKKVEELERSKSKKKPQTPIPPTKAHAIVSPAALITSDTTSQENVKTDTLPTPAIQPPAEESIDSWLESLGDGGGLDDDPWG